MTEYRLVRIDPPPSPTEDEMAAELAAELDGPLETDCAAPTDVADMT